VGAKKRILVTGVGGIGGCNFVNALRLAERQVGERLFIVGTDFNPYHILFAPVDVRIRSPRHSDPGFIKLLLSLCEKYGLEFLHPHPSVEARVVAENAEMFREKGISVFLPRPEEIAPSKSYMARRLREHGVRVPVTVEISSWSDVEQGFRELGSPLWIRVKHGAGGRLGLRVDSPEEARLWIRLNVIQGRARLDDFILQEYLPGRDLAYDSLWHEGRLIAYYCRERLEYPFKHITLSGITGTPTIARTIDDPEVCMTGRRAVEALSPKPHGFYSVDMKDDAEGKPTVTEVDGKWHTTAPLWGYAFSKILGDPSYNLAYLYLKLGYREKPGFSEKHLFPPNYYLVRQLDSGVLLVHEDRYWRIL
jgi:predicted ATP-grasp superfamily ATP-dependent carboligase